MYIPDIYKNEDPEQIRGFLRKFSFGILVNRNYGKFWATHTPMELEQDENGKEFLYGHISRENPQWQSFASGEEVMAIFNGPNSYISPSWYDHENVPTWNYAAIHVYGKISIVEGDAVMNFLEKLIDRYESTVEKPIKMKNLSPELLLQARGIVCYKIEIREIHAVNKMSQNRDDKNFRSIISKLEKTGEPNAIAVAEEMKKCPR
ncbi:MAG: FMN-binding negative transcriptional regulator [Flavobacterium sp.]|nr:FMN-binding negative transcriptional regulator [Flavobacterium sp.]